MNKQELIDELAKYVKSYENAMDEHGQGRYGAYEVSLKLVKRLNESKITDEQAWNKVAEAYPESAQSLRNTLDNAVFGKTGEPQKHVMPKFVADWFEDNKHALDLAIFTKIRELDGKRYPHETDFENWLDNAENNPIETLIRMEDGYEVEKEPLYYVVFDILQEQKFLVKNIKTKLFYLSNNENVIGNYEQVSFTEQEIKAIDERYWAFAVPVEEVVER
ncbi:DUF1642 domain-containing protein [Enterococcus faecium]|uniref:DUF1642 domain-containing protein n=1 Tax=Enterococcus faecium TaxID=1352 RepID=UPI00100E4587|nr:DUF1642 domain-containing protein [Enterococcus faecium]RXW99409.1 hypothetical protein CYQ57_05420 [Enterococcus faecium]TKN48277.1 DUF1642 domain-containing protein [Enterococcus faecium]TKN57035.1 DUF1642 domain-containing protein [Enterococcus faecium]TKN67683.1 DUF1642 domain-containing protein [Enterococcus faecium]TKN78568.1 DUF1642 domain-containing protein [Enterococcus faecium]